MQHLYAFVFLLFVQLIQALTIRKSYNEQSVYTLNRATEANKWNLETEYDVYQTIMDYYENTVDKSISLSSESLLLNLIQLPREELYMALEDQMELIGIDDIPEDSLFRIPAIIGKYIHEMNAHIYSLVQPLVLKNWHALGLSGMIYSKHNQEEKQRNEEEEENSAISFMASFNSAMAKSLLDEIKNYDLDEKIKQEVIKLISSMPSSSSSLLSSLSPIISASSSHPSYIYQIFQSVKIGISHFSKSIRPRIVSNDRQLKADFLSKYISNMETDLLIELHIQFYDFYTRVKADLQTSY